MKQFKGIDRPELDALLKRVEGYVMTKEEKETQRQSWFVGELRMLHPEMKREEAIERYKIASGGNVLDDKEAKLAEVQAAHLEAVGALENIMTQGSAEFFHAGALRGMARAALSGDGITKYRSLLWALENMDPTEPTIPEVEDVSKAFAAIQSNGEKT